MFIIPSGIPTSSAAGAYVPAYALLFDGSADQLAHRPPTDGSTTTFTISCWVKRAKLGAQQCIAAVDDNGSNYAQIQFSAADKLEIYEYSTSNEYNYLSTQVFRDTAAWYHIVVVFDTTNGTAGNRLRAYVNGSEITAWDTETNPSASLVTIWNDATYPQYIGSNADAVYFGGLIAEFIQIDGIVLTPSSFGETDSDTGIWVPKDPTDSDNISDWGGQNSFYLNFADGNNLGKDAKPTAITANPGTYKIDKSLWFDSSSTHGLTDNATPASDSNKKMTMSCWVKRAKLGDGSNSQVLWSWTRDNGANDYVQLSFLGPSDKIGMTLQTTDDGHSLSFSSNAVYRDTAAWMHILFTVDTTVDPATYDIWVNGVSIKNDLTHGATPAIAQNQTFRFGETGSYLGVGCKANDADASELDGYMADVAYLNNVTVTDASDFGGFDANGIWMPKDISGLTYGSSSFLYQFGTAPGSTNGAGTDTSGRGNHLTENDTTATRQTTDSPTNTAADNEGNFATFNSLLKTTGTFSNGNLTFLADSQSGFGHSITSTHVMTSGTYYAEFEVDSWSGTNHATIGIATTDFVTSGNYASNWTGANTQSWGYYADGSVYTNNSATSSGYTSYGIGDVIGVKLDATNGDVYFYKDGTVQNSGNAAYSGLTGPFVFSVSNAGGSTHTTITANFGQTSLSHQPGSTSTLATHNLPAVTIDPRAHFAPVLYTGTGFSRTVRGCFDSTGTAWTPDLVWLKNRDTTDNHAIWDSVRGVGKSIHPNLNAAEQDNSETNAGVTAFNSGGFSLGNFDQANTSTEKYVAWSWKIGGSPTVENDNASGAMDDGSVFVDGEVSTSYTPAGSPSVYPVKMSINTTTKMSLLTYKAGSASSIPHGLGVKPNCIFIKNISSNKGWRVGFFDYDGPTIPDDDFGFLDSNGQFNTSGNTDHLASGNVNTFSIDGDNGVSGNASWTHLAWCMASVEGFSKFGTYTGNGDTSANGPFIYLGFKPSWVMLKRTDAANNWGILDASRNSYNPVELVLYADLDQAEAGSGNQYVDFTSNGFKIKNDATANWINASSGNYVYAAFAETPFASNNRGR